MEDHENNDEEQNINSELSDVSIDDSKINEFLLRLERTEVISLVKLTKIASFKGKITNFKQQMSETAENETMYEEGRKIIYSLEKTQEKFFKPPEKMDQVLY